MKYVLTPEQKARMVAGNTSAKARKAKAASPWSRGPMCEGPKAKQSYQRYQARGPGRAPTPRGAQ